MCSPELTRGMCCICCGTLTPENTLYDDLNEGRGGVHRGKCAILAGVGLTPEQEIEAKHLIRHVHTCVNGSLQHKQATMDYYGFVDRIATEDHYDNSGP